jgi:hypothetical protein
VHKKPTEPTEQGQPDVPTIVQPLVDELKGEHNPKKPDEKAPPVGPVHPPKSAELAQDPGGGYNANHVFPQP